MRKTIAEICEEFGAEKDGGGMVSKDGNVG